VIPAPLNGDNCYDATFRTGSTEELYSIVGVGATDEKGQPQFGEAVVPAVVHQFCHSYANALVDAHLEELRPAGEKLFARLTQDTRPDAFGHWPTMMRESVARASVICYLLAYGDSDASRQALESDREEGFLWMPDLVDLLVRYDSDRGSYPDLASFMPEVVAFFNRYSESGEASPVVSLAPERGDR
jgi:hypothetical protein